MDQNVQHQAIKTLNFLSGALQLMPIELCAELAPKVLQFAEVEDAQIKINAYLTIEVLFASRRFSNYNVDENLNLVSSKALKRMLDNPEIITGLEGDGEDRQKVEKKDEMKVIAYIQALSQIILNIATTNFENSKGMDSDMALKLAASSISSLSEYIFNSTFKIQKAAISAIRLIISHGLSKIKTVQN